MSNFQLFWLSLKPSPKSFLLNYVVQKSAHSPGKILTIVHDGRRIAGFFSFILHHYIKMYLNVMLFNLQLCHLALLSCLSSKYSPLLAFMTLHPVTSICVSLSMTTQFLIYTLPLLSVYFLFLGSASAVSLSLLLLAFHSYIHILNYHWYSYALWVKFQPFSRSAHPTRHPVWMSQSLIHFSLSTSRWMVLSVPKCQSLKFGSPSLFKVSLP